MLIKYKEMKLFTLAIMTSLQTYLNYSTTKYNTNIPYYDLAIKKWLQRKSFLTSCNHDIFKWLCVLYRVS